MYGVGFVLSSATEKDFDFSKSKIIFVYQNIPYTLFLRLKKVPLTVICGENDNSKQV